MMAPANTQCFLGAHIAPTVAILTLLGTVGLMADLPELCLFGGLLVFAISSRQKIAVPQWCEMITDSKLLKSLRSRTPAWFCGMFFVAVLADVLMPFAIALLSAVSYIALYEYGKRRQPSSSKVRRSEAEKPTMSDAPARSPWRRHAQDVNAKANARTQPKAAARINKEQSQTCEVESTPRTGLDGEIHELVRNSTPTKSDDAVVRQLVKLARKSLFPVVPEADIRAIPGGNLAFIGESGAKPEIDMIVTVDPTVLAERLKAYFLRGQTRIQKSLDTLHPDVLHKTATKCLSERLTFVRFWRSQFSGPEPLIVLLVPVDMGIFSHPIRLNFSVNAPYPLRFATVLSKESMRSKELVVLVARWSRERCIANMSRGFPHQYAWALLVIYFLRNGRTSDEVEKTTAEMFRDFVQFYAELFGRQGDPVSITFSKKDVPPNAEGALWGVPYIEDPFDATKHAGACVTADGVARIKEELARARTILDGDGGAKLVELIERWTPPADTS